MKFWIVIIMKAWFSRTAVHLCQSSKWWHNLATVLPSVLPFIWGSHRDTHHITCAIVHLITYSCNLSVRHFLDRKGWPTIFSFHHVTRCWQFYSCGLKVRWNILCVCVTQTFFLFLFRSCSKHTLALFRSTVLFSHVCWSVYGEGLPGGICLETSLHFCHSRSAL